MVLSRYICLFFIYSLIGWIYETLFCTIKSPGNLRDDRRDVTGGRIR